MPTALTKTNGWEKINGVWYRFDYSGWMQTGWAKDGSWYYLDGSGAMKTGWVKITVTGTIFKTQAL